MPFIPTFLYPADAAAIKTAGEPITPMAQPMFATLAEEAKSLIVDDKGAHLGLKTLLTNAFIEQSEETFELVGHGAELPDGMREEIEARAEKMSNAISESIGFAIVASIINFHGTTGPDGITPILTYTTAGAAQLNLPLPQPLTVGVFPNGVQALIPT